MYYCSSLLLESWHPGYVNVNSDICSECFCHCQNSSLVANGFCNNETNTFECNFDGGDCCVNVNADYCTDCLCIGDGVITSPGFPLPYSSQ